jgi:HPt (histidine-containing phosphotransfer) domain-containing protein
MPDPVSAESLQKPNPRDAVGLTLILLLEVFVFMGAVFGIALTDAIEAKATAETLTASKLVSRQNTLLERISADLAQIETMVKKKDPERATVAADLDAAATQFGAALGALKSGGPVTLDGSGSAPVQAHALTSAVAVQNLQQAQTTWSEVSPAIAAVAGNPADKTNVLAAAEQLAGAKAGLTNSLDAIQADVGGSGSANSRNVTMRDWLFRLAIVMVLALVITLFRRVSRSRRQLETYAKSLENRTEEAIDASRQLAEAKAGTDRIMETVDRGLFLIGPDLRIQGQYSRELERIFRTPELDGYNLLNVLQRLLTERMFEISREYLALLFDRKKKERTVLRVNPLAEVEVHFANPAGGFDTKFLNFTFRRIIDGDEVTRVFVAVSDITDRVRLERQLRESESRKERQFEFLLGVLHVDAKSLDDFLKTANEQIAVMNDALRASDFASSTDGRMDLLRKRLDIVYRAVHTVKGNAAMLQLSYFIRVCDGFEGKIVQLRDRRALGGDDFLSIVMAQAELRQDLEELQELRERFVGLGRMPVAAREVLTHKAAASGDVVGSISNFALQIGDRLRKEVRVEAGGFDTDGLNDEVQRTIKDVLIQLTRNSLIHGIEPPQLREALGKPRVATLTIRQLANAPGNAFSFSFRDDGRGLDPNHIRERAVAKQIVSPQIAATMSDEQLVALIFRPGFSTLDEPVADGGRGIGMNVIKEAIVDKLGGRLGLNSEPGRFTEFSFSIPLERRSRAVRSGVAALAHS